MTIRILNIAVLVVAIVLAIVLVRKYLLKPAQTSDYRIAANATLRIDGINWADSNRTVLIALSKECKYCSDSAKFYRRLAAGLSKQTGTRLVAVFSEKESAAENYLKQLDIPIQEVRYVSLSSLGITTVPIVAILDRNGVVTDMWGGKLSPMKETALMSKLGVADNTSESWSIDAESLALKLANKESLVLLDVRDRSLYSLDHREGSRNIPLDELPVRAQNELPLDQTIVIVSTVPSEADLAYSILESKGFSNLFILNSKPSQ